MPLPPPWRRHTRMVAIISVQPSAEGISTFQPSRMSWSYRIRGSEARSQKKTNTNTLTLPTNHSSGHQLVLAPDHTEIGHGACQPPRNKVMASAETVITLQYSASWVIANFSDEYRSEEHTSE